MNLNHDFRTRVVQHAADAAWTPLPLAGVERHMLDRVEDKIAHVTSIVRYAGGSRIDAHRNPDGEEILVRDNVLSDKHHENGPGALVRSYTICHS